jgi:hypothetical protein
MNTVDDVLALDSDQLQASWKEIDRIVQSLPSRLEQIRVWEQICERLDKNGSLKGHPFFRLGVLHLLEDSDEQSGLKYFELAYKEDKKYAETSEIRAEGRGAYRLLAIVKDFFAYLRSKKQQDWEAALLLGENRKVLIPMLFILYDLSTAHPLDMPGFTVLDFQKLIKNDALRRFAGENYFCAENLLVLVTLKGQHINKDDQYPLGRATVGLIGGVLEAIWLDRLPSAKLRTLGGLLKEAHKKGVLQLNTKIASLSSLLCFMRNHIHPDRDAQRLDYFIDMNVAKGCKVALDMAIADLNITVKPES